MWTKPAATEMRFGFEVTMYVMNKQFVPNRIPGRFGALFFLWRQYDQNCTDWTWVCWQLHSQRT